MKIEVPGYGEMDENDEIKIGGIAYKAKDIVSMLKNIEGKGGIHIVPHPTDPLQDLSRTTLGLIDAARRKDRQAGVRMLLGTSSAMMRIFGIRPAPVANTQGSPEREGSVDAVRMMADILDDSPEAAQVAQINTKDLREKADESEFLYDMIDLYRGGDQFTINYAVPRWRETVGVVRQVLERIEPILAGNFELNTRLGTIRNYLKGPAVAGKKTRNENVRRDESIRKVVEGEIGLEARNTARHEIEDRLRGVLSDVLSGDNKPKK